MNVSIEHIHPMLVHFPIVLIYALFAIDLTTIILRRVDVTGRNGVGTISAAIAVGSGVLAIGTWYFGGLALDHAEAGGFGSNIAEIHEGLGEITAFAFLAWGAIRLGLWVRNRSLGSAAIAIPIVEAAGAILVTITAYYGGQLVYDLGVNVTKVAVGG